MRPCATAAGMLAHALYALDRLDEADAWAGRSAELGASDDAFTQMLWRPVRAKVLAHRGQHPEAERLAREAVAITEATQDLYGQGDAYANLAVVLLHAGNSDKAVAALQQASESLQTQGNLVSAESLKTRFAELHAEVRTVKGSSK